jgi:cell division protein FtsZ
VLYQGVKGVTDLMVRPGIINLDFADVRSVMNEMGKAMMGTGEAAGEDRAVQAAEKAIANPLLDEISLKGAKGVLINITAGPDLTLFELDEAANRIRSEVDPEANIMVGSTLDPEMAGQMRVSVVATGIDAVAKSDAMPVPRRATAEPVAAPAPVAAAAPQPRPAPASQPAPEPVVAHSSNFADAQAAEAVREVLFAEPEAGAPGSQEVPQPGSLQRTAPYGQPKFEADGERRAGEPSPDALRRLQAAVQNVPKAPPMIRPAAPAPREAERASRLTINSLIHKMTGQIGREAAAPRPRPAAEAGFESRPAQPSAQDYEDSERERVDIPAFLRRQAN